MLFVYVCVYRYLFCLHLFSCDNEHLSHFQFLAVTNIASINTHVKSLCEYVFFFLWGKSLVEWLDHMAKIFS